MTNEDDKLDDKVSADMQRYLDEKYGKSKTKGKRVVKKIDELDEEHQKMMKGQFPDTKYIILVSDLQDLDIEGE